MTKFEKIMNEEMSKEAMIMLLNLPRRGKDCEVSFIHKAETEEGRVKVNGNPVDVVIGIQEIVEGVAKQTNCEVKEVYEYLMKTA